MSSERAPDERLLKFMSVYPGHVQDKALRLRENVLKEAPNAFELIYDSYNALSTAFSFTDDLKEAFCHIALYSKHVNLGFNYGSELEDTNSLLIGSGKHIRHLKIKNTEDLESPHIQKFIEKAIEHINQKFPEAGQATNAKAIVKTVSDNKVRPNL